MAKTTFKTIKHIGKVTLELSKNTLRFYTSKPFDKNGDKLHPHTINGEVVYQQHTERVKDGTLESYGLAKSDFR